MNEPAQTVESVAWLQERLRVAARRYRRTEATVFAAAAVSTGAIGFGVYFLADFWLRFPGPVRMLLTAGLAGAAGFWGRRTARRWIVPCRTLDATARAVELAEDRAGRRRHSTVVSALEFGERPAIPGAAVFKNVVIRAAHAESLDPARVALHARAHVALLRKLAAAALAVALGLVAAWPRPVIFARRLFGLAAAYPTATQLSHGPWPAVAPARVDYPVAVMVGGRIPLSGTLTVRDASRHSYSLPMTPQSNGTFAAVVQAPEDSFSFSCALGDAETEPFRVTVHKPPLVRGVTATVTPPAYTGLPRRDEADETVTVPEGSRVQFAVAPDGPLDACALEGEGRRIVCKPDAQGRWRGGDVFTDSWVYAVAMTNAAGLGNMSASPRRIQVVCDTAPAIELRSPKPNSAVAPIGSLVFDFVARDDFGLTEAGVDYEVYERRDNADVLVRKDSFRAPAPPSGREAAVRITKNVADLGLVPGQTLVVRGYAADNRPAPGAQRGESDQATVSVVTAEDLRRMIEMELQQVGGLLQRLSDEEQRQSDVLRERLVVQKEETR